MLFFENRHKGKKYICLVENGNKQNYECIFSVCPNPACTCMTINIDLTFMSDQNHEDLARLCHSVEIDLEKRKLQTSPKKKLPPEEKAFGDQFCLLPKCKCTDATLELVPAGEDAMMADPWCAFRLKYAKRDWAVMEDSPSPISLEEIRTAIERQLPDFYKQLLRRHKKLKMIYLNCRRKHYSPPQTITGRKAGRNDPCPCGSGKKYKKCCLKSTKPIEFPDNRSDTSGFQFPDDFKL